MHSADNATTHEAALAKKVVIPIQIKGHTSYPTSATKLVKDPFGAAAEVILASTTASTLDSTFTSGTLTGTAPAKFCVVVLDGNAKRFRKGRAIVKTADSAGNAAQFVVGVVEDGNGTITTNGNVAVTITLNGALSAAVGVSGTQLDVELEWN